MREYIGVKRIKAKKCTACEASKILGRKVDAENADNGEGYLVEYNDGYKSWSPAEPFEEAYRPVEGVTFGIALEAMKRGEKVARAGWNGKSMYLSVQDGSVINSDKARGGVAKSLADSGVEEIIILPHIGMKNANGEVVVGWLASQEDMLSEDWMIIE